MTAQAGDALMGDAGRARLKEYFTVTQPTNSAITSRWSEMWDDKSEWKALPFDRGFPNPALEETLELARSYLPVPVDEKTGKRRKALVPGCGRGYDAILLSSFGYDTIGLEYAPTAAKEAAKYAARIDEALNSGVGSKSEENEDMRLEMYRTRDQKIGRGSVRFIQGDFWDDSWRKDLAEGQWDILFDYTFCCAFPPDVRPKWATRVRDLVKQDGGRLVCCEFPTYKDPKTGGPPWALYPEMYLALLGRPGNALTYDSDGRVLLDEMDKKKLEAGEALSEDGMARMTHWQPKKTHKIGENTDWIGIWQKATAVSPH